MNIKSLSCQQIFYHNIEYYGFALQMEIIGVQYIVGEIFRKIY